MNKWISVYGFLHCFNETHHQRVTSQLPSMKGTGPRTQHQDQDFQFVSAETVALSQFYSLHWCCLSCKFVSKSLLIGVITFYGIVSHGLRLITNFPFVFNTPFNMIMVDQYDHGRSSNFVAFASTILISHLQARKLHSRYTHIDLVFKMGIKSWKKDK